MKPDGQTDEIGRVLGHEAFEHAEVHGEDYCLRERQRMEIANEPAILALRAQMAILQEEAQHFEERLRKAPPPGDARPGAKSVSSTGASLVYSLPEFCRSPSTA
jgi:hypothetical protein